MVSFRTAIIGPSHLLMDRLKDVARLRSRTTVRTLIAFTLFNTAFSYRNIDFEEGSIGKLVSVLYEHTRLIAHSNERAPDAVNAFQIGRYTLHYSNPYLKHT